jgi:hypothetical protein
MFSSILKSRILVAPRTMTRSEVCLKGKNLERNALMQDKNVELAVTRKEPLGPSKYSFRTDFKS